MFNENNTSANTYKKTQKMSFSLKMLKKHSNILVVKANQYLVDSLFLYLLF